MQDPLVYKTRRSVDAQSNIVGRVQTQVTTRTSFDLREFSIIRAVLVDAARPVVLRGGKKLIGKVRTSDETLSRKAVISCGPATAQKPGKPSAGLPAKAFGDVSAAVGLPRSRASSVAEV